NKAEWPRLGGSRCARALAGSCNNQTTRIERRKEAMTEGRSTSSLYVRSNIQTDNPTPTILRRRNVMNMHRFLNCGITPTNSSRLRIWQRSVLILVGVFSLVLTPLSSVIADQ